MLPACGLSSLLNDFDVEAYVAGNIIRIEEEEEFYTTRMTRIGDCLTLTSFTSRKTAKDKLKFGLPFSYNKSPEPYGFGHIF